MPRLSHELARRAGAVAGTRILLLLLGTAVSVVIARVLGPDGRGEYAFAVAIASSAIVLAHASVEQSQIFLFSQGVSIQRLAAGSAPLAMFLGSLAVATVLLVSWTFDYPVPSMWRDAGWLFALAAIPLALLVLYTNGLLVLSGRTDLLNRGSLLAGLVQCVLLVWLAARGDLTVTSVLAVWLINTALPLLVSLRYLRPRRSGLEVGLLRRELAIGLRYHPGLACLYLLLRVDVLILAAQRSDEEVGWYALAVGLIELTYVATDSLAIVVLAKQSRASLADSARLTARVVGISGALAFLLTCALVATSPVLIPLVYGQEFREAVPAIYALAPGVLALAAARSAAGYLIRLNRPWLVSGVYASALLVNIVLNVALIPTLGIVGAGLASSTAYAFLALTSIAWLKRSGHLAAGDFLAGLRGDRHAY